MNIRFILYENAFIKQTVGMADYDLISKFPKSMYKDVRCIAENYQGIHPNMEVIIYSCISLEEVIQNKPKIKGK